MCCGYRVFFREERGCVEKGREGNGAEVERGIDGWSAVEGKLEVLEGNIAREMIRSSNSSGKDVRRSAMLCCEYYGSSASDGVQKLTMGYAYLCGAR